jgi:hypothetical protein
MSSQRLRILATVVAAAAIATTLAASPAGAAKKKPIHKRTLHGIATVRLVRFDYCSGNRQAVGRATYRRKALLYIGRPAQAAGLRETNPFHFMFAVGNQADALSFLVDSAVVETTSGIDLDGQARDPRLMLQYWQFTQNRRHQLKGTLTDTHTAEAAAINLFSGPTLLVPCEPQFGTYTDEMPLGQNSTLAGRLHGRHARVAVAGTTYNSLYHYVIHFRTRH